MGQRRYFEIRAKLKDFNQSINKTKVLVYRSTKLK